MKNIFRTGISILLVMSLMLAAMPLAFAADSYYYEDFEDFSFSTYTWDSSNYTVKLGESDTGYCINVDVKVKGNATSDLKYVSYKNLSMTGKVTMEFDFMTNIDFGLVAFFNGGKKADVFNHLRDGRGAFAGDYSKGTRAPVWFDEKGGDNILTEGKWYHVALYMDLSKSTYTYKIDGKSGKNCGNDYSVIYNTIQLPAGSTTLTGFGIIGTWAGGDISIDNLEIYQGDKAEGGSSFKSGLGSKLTALGVLETAPDESLSITKAEFTKMLLKAMGITPVGSDSGVEFSDIDNHPDRPYLEYAISMGILSGKGDGTLGPDDVLDMGTAAKMAVSALGAQAMADAKGGYQAGYLESAKRLDLLDNIEADESFTYKQAMQMIWNFLEAPALDMYGNKLEPVMYQYLGLSRLKGEVTSFDPDSLYISLDVTEENGEDVTKTETFRIPKEYSSFNWDGVIAEVYMDDDYNVLYIEPYEDSGSRYGYLYSVNDKMESGSVSADTIKELSLFDGSEFKAHKDMELCVNGTPVSSAVLNNAFVHLVLEENRVVRMDIINDRVDPIYGNMLIEGGIINSTREDEIRFTSGENNYGLIEDADKEGYTVVVGGTAGTIKQLKKGMLFDYKINSDGSYFFVAANRTVEGTVDELSSDVIKIGGAEYLLSEGSVYVQENGEDYYRTDIPLNSLLGVSVDASLDPTGRVRYIRLNEDGSEFYGIVCGARKASGLDSTRELMIFTRNGESIYKMAEKQNDSFGFVDFDTAAANARDVSGKGVYKFYKNSKDEITGIESISWINDMGTSISVIGDSNAIAKLGSYYVDSRNIFSVTNKEGEFEPRVANWSVNLQSSKIHPVIGLKMLFSEPVEEEFYSRVAVVTTGFETLFQQGSDDFGFITRISKMCDENGEEGVRVLMTNRLGKEYSFTVPADRMYFDVNGKKETFKENAFLHFMQPKNGANIPMVMDFLDLDADNWEGMGGNYVTKLEHYGTFERIRNNEIYCRLNGESKGMYMRPNTNVTGYRYDNEKGRYDTVPLTDLVGQDVWCITVNSYIVAVICQR